MGMKSVQGGMRVSKAEKNILALFVSELSSVVRKEYRSDGAIPGCCNPDKLNESDLTAYLLNMNLDLDISGEISRFGRGLDGPIKAAECLIKNTLPFTENNNGQFIRNGQGYTYRPQSNEEWCRDLFTAITINWEKEMEGLLEPISQSFIESVLNLVERFYGTEVKERLSFFHNSYSTNAQQYCLLFFIVLSGEKGLNWYSRRINGTCISVMSASNSPKQSLISTPTLVDSCRIAGFSIEAPHMREHVRHFLFDSQLDNFTIGADGNYLLEDSSFLVSRIHLDVTRTDDGKLCITNNGNDIIVEKNKPSESTKKIVLTTNQSMTISSHTHLHLVFPNNEVRILYPICCPKIINDTSKDECWDVDHNITIGIDRKKPNSAFPDIELSCFSHSCEMKYVSQIQGRFEFNTNKKSWYFVHLGTNPSKIRASNGRESVLTKYGEKKNISHNAKLSFEGSPEYRFQTS